MARKNPLDKIKDAAKDTITTATDMGKEVAGQVSRTAVGLAGEAVGAVRNRVSPAESPAEAEKPGPAPTPDPAARATADATPPAAGLTRTPAKKTAAKKTAAKKTAAKKTAATSTATSTAKKGAAKKSATSEAASTTAAEKAAATPAAKKTGATKASAKKTSAKKTAAKKTSAKKTATKKTATKKTTATPADVADNVGTQGAVPEAADTPSATLPATKAQPSGPRSASPGPDAAQAKSVRSEAETMSAAAKSPAEDQQDS